MVIDEFIHKPSAWLSRTRGTGIVVSSRIRLARNIRGVAFPGWAGESERVALCARIREILGGVAGLEDGVFLDMAELSDVDKSLLVERHLISHELARRGCGSGALVSGDERITVMINEEDHLRIQVICPGLHIDRIWQTVDAIDTAVERELRYAFSPEFGHLTACPTNVGTGLRASVMLHLAGLRLTEELEQVVRGLGRLGLAVRGLMGEGTEAYGNMFQISNQETLGEPEETIVKRLTRIVRDVARIEQNARDRLSEEKPRRLLDCAARSLGLLCHARLLTSGEALNLLSGVRLGVELGLVKNLTIARLNEIMLLTQPAHLQKMSRRSIDAEERDGLRADMARGELKRAKLVPADA